MAELVDNPKGTSHDHRGQMHEQLQFRILQPGTPQRRGLPGVEGAVRRGGRHDDAGRREQDWHPADHGGLMVREVKVCNMNNFFPAENLGKKFILHPDMLYMHHLPLNKIAVREEQTGE